MRRLQIKVGVVPETVTESRAKLPAEIQGIDIKVTVHKEDTLQGCCNKCYSDCDVDDSRIKKVCAT